MRFWFWHRCERLLLDILRESYKDWSFSGILCRLKDYCKRKADAHVFPTEYDIWAASMPHTKPEFKERVESALAAKR